MTFTLKGQARFWRRVAAWIDAHPKRYRFFAFEVVKRDVIGRAKAAP